MPQRQQPKLKELQSTKRQPVAPLIQQIGVHLATPTPQASSAPQLPHATIQRALADPRALTPAVVQRLQGTIGNRAVQRLLTQSNQQTATASERSTPSTQRSLRVGAANDHLEQEADQMAGQVVQRKGVSERTPKKSAGEAFETSPDFDRQLSSTKGGGRALPQETRREMESSFGADFSNVRIHTGADSNQLNRSIQAEAFTHGNDIHFSDGEYNPTSTQGKQLLAHELTHTIQQTSGGTLQRQPGATFQTKGQSGVSSHAPALTIQRKLKTTSSDLGKTSLKAKGNKWLGDESTFSLLKKALDQYHHLFEKDKLVSDKWVKQLLYLYPVQHYATEWIRIHNDAQDSTKDSAIQDLLTEVDNEILNLKNGIDESIYDKKEYDDLLRTDDFRQRHGTMEFGNDIAKGAVYLDQLRSGKFKYISEEATTISGEMSDWYAGRETETDPTKDPEKKYRYKGRGAEVSALTQKHGLTLAEATAIATYSASDFNYINPAWANNPTWMQSKLKEVGIADKNIKDSVRQDVAKHTKAASQEGMAHGKVALSGLKKLPDWRGMVYRGESWDKEVIESRFKLGAVGTFDSFTSTSKKQERAKYFLTKTPKGKIGILLKMYVENGKDITVLSDMPFEWEVLLLPGTKYKVTDFKKIVPQKGLEGGELSEEQKASRTTYEVTLKVD